MLAISRQRGTLSGGQLGLTIVLAQFSEMCCSVCPMRWRTFCTLCGIFSMICSGWAGVDLAGRSKTGGAGNVKQPQFIRKGRGKLGWLGGGLSPGKGVAENLAQACLSPAGSAGISFSPRITKQKQLQIQRQVQPKQRLQTSSFQAMERLARTLFRSRPSFCPPLAVPLLPPSYKFLPFFLSQKQENQQRFVSSESLQPPPPQKKNRGSNNFQRDSLYFRVEGQLIFLRRTTSYSFQIRKPTRFVPISPRHAHGVLYTQL